MAVTMADITHLRKMSGAGMMDCKKALEEADNDFEKAMEIIRKKGQAVAAKRSDREAAEGCVLAADEGGFAAIVALKCETDFVAKNADFVALTQDILNAAMTGKPASKEALLAATLQGGRTVENHITDRIGVTGEKMELDGYNFIEGENIYTYNHMNKNLLCTMVQTNKPAAEEGHAVTMQVAAMKPIALDEASVPQSVKDEELKVAIEKTKEEQVEKAVQAALKKAGFNLYIAENEEHIAEGIAKGEITEAQADEIRRIKKEVAEEKAAALPVEMVNNIAKGRMAKFFKESCLLEQEFIQDSKLTVAQYLKAADKDLTVVAFKRFTLRAE